MNAQIDGNRSGLENVVGPHGTSDSTNDNGERLLLFCNMNNLCIGNTFFEHKRIHKKTWRSPDGRTYNEIDFICVGSRWRSALQDVRVFRGADVGSDHYLLVAHVRLRFKRREQHKPTRPYAVERLRDRAIAEQFRLELKNRFEPLASMPVGVDDQWYELHQVIRDSADKVVQRRRGTQRERWIQDRTWQLIDSRKIAKLQREQAKTQEEKEDAEIRYSTLDKQVKSSCRSDKRDWLERKGAEAQAAAEKNDLKCLYTIVRELTGTRCASNVPIKDKAGRLLLTREEQDARWIEHFREILNQPAPISIHDFGTLAPSGVLDAATEDVTAAETAHAIKMMKNNKAPGLDEISAELLKCGGDCLVHALTNLFNNCWQQECVPNDWRKGVIVRLPKKGSTSDCNNWRGITLLSVPGKVFCLVLLQRLKGAVDKILREEQAGFRQGRSCSEQIFVLRNIIEQSIEFQKPLIINFIDFKKAFDSVHRESLWNIVASYGIPQKYVNIFRNLYLDSTCCVKTNEGFTDFFKIETGVRQGCTLSPFLFLLVIDFVMKRTMVVQGTGIPWVNRTRLTDLDFADDIVLFSETRPAMQSITTMLETEGEKVGLRIGIDKTKVLCVGRRTKANITVGNEVVEEVERFCYLGSIMTCDGGAEDDIQCRIGKASAVFQRLRPIWTSSSISIAIKVRLYTSLVMPIAIYACETWKSTKRLDQKLNVFHQRCLRRILGITYRDRVTNEEVLRRSELSKLRDIIAERRMRFAGHLLRLPDQRIPGIAMNWMPSGGKRKRGRPKITWRSTFKEDLRNVNIAWEDAKAVAADRVNWRTLVAQCANRHRRT